MHRDSSGPQIPGLDVVQSTAGRGAVGRRIGLTSSPTIIHTGHLGSLLCPLPNVQLVRLMISECVNIFTSTSILALDTHIAA
jgi:hypothetical protein